MTTRICAVLIMDMAGFSALCLPREGETEDQALDRALDHLTAFLAVGRRAVADHDGEWIKTVADDFFAVFPTVRQAHAAAAQVTAAIPSAGGIGHGRIRLSAGGPWGIEVNRASRLGEDEAKAGEVLPTPAARARLAEEDRP